MRDYFLHPMVAIIKYNAGNTRSVAFALQRLGLDFIITDDHETIRRSDKVIFPGVGEASSTMNFLKKKGLDLLITSLTQPVLGICLGMQVMCKHSEENDTIGLGIFDLHVKKFIATHNQKVPHTGWNNLTQTKGWLGTSFSGKFVYFVHSYFVPVSEHTVAETQYISPFSAALQKDNFYAVQFHPEKSGDVGEQILSQFLKKT